MWIETRSGIRVQLLSPDPKTIELADICYALAQLPRFTGHGPERYSVLDHSLNVGLLLPDDCRIYGFLHDAAEAYIGDISTPLKRWLDRMLGGRLARMEDGLLSAIYQSLGIPAPTAEQKKEIKSVDNLMLQIEATIFGFSWAFPYLDRDLRSRLVYVYTEAHLGESILRREIQRIKNA